MGRQVKAGCAPLVAVLALVLGLPSGTHAGSPETDSLKALSSADAVLNRLPFDASAHARRGEALWRLGRRDEAAASLALAFNQEPLNERLAVMHTEARLWQGDYALALPPALYLVALAQGRPAEYARRKALALRLMRSIPRAQTAVLLADTARHLDSTSYGAHFRVFAGDCAKSLGDNQGSLAHYKQALALAPKKTAVRLRFARALETEKHAYREALEQYTAARINDHTSEEAASRQNRLAQRLTGQKNDLAWALKDLIAQFLP